MASTPLTPTTSGPRQAFVTGSPTQIADLKERFYRYFQDEATAIQEQIARLEQTSQMGGERQDAVDHCLAGISRLTTEVQDASSYIPAYDQRTYSQAIKALTEKLQETRSKFAPKARFSFKPKKDLSDTTESISNAASPAALAPETPSSQPEKLHTSKPTSTSAQESLRSIEYQQTSSSPAKNYNADILASSARTRQPSFTHAKNVSISDHSGIHIILPSSAAHATSSGSLTQLTRCIVDMSIPTASGKPFAGLALKNIKSSLIVAGQVAGAAHMTAIMDSIVVVASRQVRMHDCRNVDVYLLCSSRPIIEDCQNIRFAPIPECYMVKSDAPLINHWDQVDDFKWLKAEHSPNWSTLPEEERIPEEVWTTVVPGKPGIGVQDILKVVGIKEN